MQTDTSTGKPQEKQYTKTYICNKCDILLIDGVFYTYCPRCNSKVNFIDLSKDIYVCPKCDFMVNKTLNKKEAQNCYCKKCKKIRLKRMHSSGLQMESWKYKKIHEYFKDSATNILIEVFSFFIPAASFLLIGFLILTLKFKTDLFLLVALLFLPLLPIAFWGAFVSLKEIIAAPGFLLILLVKGGKGIRLNHGFEHATINILLENRIPVFRGQADLNGFRINAPTNPMNIGLAFTEAVKRIKQGENRLTVSRRCGTTMGVMGLLYIISFLVFLSLWQLKLVNPFEAYILMISFFLLFYFLKYPISIVLQKKITTAFNFTEAHIAEIKQVDTKAGESTLTYYVSTKVAY